MSLTISLPSVLARLADGNRSVTALGATVGEAAGGQPYPFVTFYLNDEDIRFTGGFTAPVREGDELTIVSAVAGG